MSSTDTECRSCRRYSLQFDVEYRVFAKGHAIVAGTAKTLNISSHGVFLTPTEGASKGQLIELSIKWNTGVSGSRKINLEILGRVLRHDSSGTAVRILRYGFSAAKQARPAESAPVEE